jgi:hypothetical protein
VSTAVSTLSVVRLLLANPGRESTSHLELAEHASADEIN